MMSGRVFTYEASRTGAAFHSAVPGTYLYKGIRGVPGGGKTVICHQDIVMKSHMQPPIFDPATRKMVRWTRWGMFRDTFQALQKTTIKDWLDWHPIGENMTMHWSPPISGVYEIPSMLKGEDGVFVRIELEFYATGAPTFENDLDGLSLSGAYFNEAAAQSWPLIHKVQERVGRFKPPGASAQGWKGLSFGVLMDTNAPTDSSWWYQLEQLDKPDRMLWFIQPPAMIRTTDRDGKTRYIRNDETNSKLYGTSGPCENVEHLTDGWDYYEKQLVGADEDYIKRRLLNEYGKVKAGEPVWPSFMDSIHCTDKDLVHERGNTTLVGMDFGRNPAAVICQQSRLGQFRVLDELCEFNMMVPQFVESRLIPLLVDKYNWPNTPVVVFGDPAGIQKNEMSDISCYMYLESKGLRVSKPDLRNNDVKVRIMTVDGMLRNFYKGVPMFIMSAKCKTLREAMNGGYCYRRKKTAVGEEYEDKPDKGKFSHIADGLQYVAVGATGGASMYGGMMKDAARVNDAGGWSPPVPQQYCNFGCA